MKIFVTGATGYVGSALIERLLQREATVTALCRSGANTRLLQRPRVNIAVGDLSNPDVIASAMKGCEQVYHVAAYARVWAKDPSLFHEVNVEGTRNVLDAAHQAGVRKVVFTSTAGVMGPSPDGLTPVDEDTERAHPFFNEYERTKWEAEQLCKQFADEGKLHVTIVNPSRVYGPGADTDSNAISRLISLYLSGRWRFIPGDGKSIGNYTYLEDVVEGHIAAMEKGRSGQRYILGGENVSFNEFFQLLRQLTGIDRTLFHLPLGIMLGFAKLESVKARLFKVAPLVTPEWVRKYLYHWPLSSGKAIRELDYRVTSLPIGLGKTILEIQSKNQ